MLALPEDGILELLSLVYSSPGNENALIVSKFLGKVAIEALAFNAKLTNMSLDERVNHQCLNNLKKYVRYVTKNDYWPYYERIKHHPEAGLQDPITKEYYTIVFSMKFIYTQEGYVFHQFLLCGTEFTIDLLNPTTQLIEEWFKNNNNRSPVLEEAINQGFNKRNTLNHLDT